MAHTMSYAAAAFLAASLFGCKDSGVVVAPPHGLDDHIHVGVLLAHPVGPTGKAVRSMQISEPDLFVCAGHDGVWRLNLRAPGAWDSLGPGSRNPGPLAVRGAVDLDVSGNTLLVACDESAPGVGPDSMVAVWKSLDRGRTWAKSDSGIPESRKYPQEANAMLGIRRSPSSPQIILAVYGPAAYQSTNEGSSWRLVSGERGLMVNNDHLVWNPHKSGEVWFFGETPIDEGYIQRSGDYGMTRAAVSFQGLGLPPTIGASSICFDSGDPSLVYVATGQAFLKSSDGGTSWISVWATPSGPFIGVIAEDARTPHSMFLAGTTEVFHSSAGGPSMMLLGAIPGGTIMSLLPDYAGAQILIGTDRGIYTLPFVPLQLSRKTP